MIFLFAKNIIQERMVFENEVEVLKDKIADKDNLINKLQAEKEKFKDYYHKFKGFWYDVIKRFQGMIGYYKDTHYEHVAKDLFKM